MTLYLEFASLTAADAVSILNVATRDRQPRRLPAPPVPGSGSAAETSGDLRRLQLLGRFSLEELTAEIATQARCDVALIEGQYRLARCD